MGYWSNINKENQTALLSALENNNCRNVVKEKLPHLEDIIFAPNRSAGLVLLEIKDSDIGIDYGCMWGGLLIYAAKNCKAMVGIDQTLESLKFLKYRLRDEKLANCFLVNTNLRESLELDNIFDFAIINGVLEWIPEESEVELSKFFAKRKWRFKKPARNPRLDQIEFLKMVYKNLKQDGRLYLAIENRYDYQYFLWKKDTHSSLFYTAFLPRRVSNITSNISYGRPYLNYLYSHQSLEKLLKQAGFAYVEKYASFPDYRFPLKIIPFKEARNSSYNPIYKMAPTDNILKKGFRVLRKYMDFLIYNRMQLFSLAPSFIIIAKK